MNYMQLSSGGWLGKMRITFTLAGGFVTFTAETGAQAGVSVSFNDGTTASFNLNLHNTQNVRTTTNPPSSYQGKSITVNTSVKSNTWFAVKDLLQPNAGNGYTCSFIVESDIHNGVSAYHSPELLVSLKLQ